MNKITKRDVSFFFLGILAMLLVETVLDWENSVKSFKNGLKATQTKSEKEQVK